MLQDLRFATRALLKAKTYSLTVVLTLALCIGANVTIFSTVYTVLLQPLQVPDAHDILLLYNSYPGATGAGGDVRGATSIPHYFDRLRAVDVFDEQALYQGSGFTLGQSAQTEQVLGWRVTPSFFRLAAVPPSLGRVFAESEGEIGNEYRVVLSYPLWQRLHGGDPAAVGRELRLDSRPYEIVGVMPAGFSFEDEDVQLWVPLAIEDSPASPEERHSNAWQMIGRLKAGATLTQAQAQIDQLTAAEFDVFPEFRQLLADTGFHTVVMPLQEEMVRDIRGSLYLLWGAVLFVLLIGAINVANLMLIRSNVRLKDVALRYALGAGRLRLARQGLTESVLLTLIAAALGLGIAQAALQFLGTLGADELPGGGRIAIDGVIAAWTLGAATVLGLVLGLVPVISLSTANLQEMLRQESRSGTATRGVRAFRNALVVSQIAVACVLLIGAVLLLVSFQRILAIETGFRPDNLLTAQVSLPEASYPEPSDRGGFAERALNRLRQLPGVVDMTLTSTIPFGRNENSSVIRAVGYEERPGESLVAPSLAVVDGRYFDTLGVPLIEGRSFDERDTVDSMPVIVIDERLARRFWPDRSALGGQLYQNVELTEDTTVYTVVGVVAEHALRGVVNAPDPVGAYFFSHTQRPLREVTLAMRTEGDPHTLVNPLRQAISELDAERPVFFVQSMDELIAKSLTPRRTPMVLALGFAGIALFLSALGIYGVISYRVAQRSREFGIRMALGCNARQLFAMVLSEGAALLGLGLIVGVGGEVLLGDIVGSQLYDVQATNPWVVLSVVVMLSCVAMMACALPARRATRVDPVSALNHE